MALRLLGIVCVGLGLASAQPDSVARISIAVFGDVNLGRTVGQIILKGEIDHPFENVREYFSKQNIVFFNLESQLSDQNGETEDPKSNIVFCGPPVAAASVRRANVSVVSTANNHAFDYGMKGLRETITLLRSEGVSVAGTSFDSSAMFPPSVIERNSIRVGIVAYTQFVNKMESWDGRESWQGYVSVFDSQRVQLEIEDVRKKTDFVIASYHGGKEYADLPDSKTREEMRSLIDAGADLVVGHHPHVPQGIEEYKGRLIFYSLGNFVFHQAPYWTQRGLGIEMQLEKQGGSARLSAVRLVPVQAGYQPALSLNPTDRARLMKRIQSLSNVPLVVRDGQYFVQIPNSQAHNDQ